MIFLLHFSYAHSIATFIVQKVWCNQSSYPLQNNIERKNYHH